MSSDNEYPPPKKHHPSEASELCPLASDSWSTSDPEQSTFDEDDRIGSTNEENVSSLMDCHSQGSGETCPDLHKEESNSFLQESQVSNEGEKNLDSGDSEPDLSEIVDQQIEFAEMHYEDGCSLHDYNEDANILSDPISEPNIDTSFNFNNSDQLLKKLKSHFAVDISSECDNINNTVLDSSLVNDESLSTDLLNTSTHEAQATHYASTPFKADASLSQPYHPKVSPIKFEEVLNPPNTDNSNFSSESGTESDDQDGTDSSEGESYAEEEKSDNSDTDVESAEQFGHFLGNVMHELEMEDREQPLDETLECFYESGKVFSEACLFNDVKVHSSSPYSVNEAILDFMKLYLKNKLSKAGLDRTIQNMCKFLPEDHKLPNSSYKLLSYVERLAPPAPAIIHYFCEKCLYYHGTSIGQCVICKEGTKLAHFYNFDLSTLIKFFFECRGLASIMDSESEKRKNRDPKILTDLKDGTVYQALNKNREKYDINLIFNTDGVRIRKGSKRELWLAIITIAELPIHLQKSFLTVVSVWYHERKPSMKTFLKPFAESMESLHLNGVEWTHPVTKEVNRSCAQFAVAVLDAPARAKVQNVMAFNSKYGCNLCEIKSQLSQPIPDHKCLRVYHYVKNPILRTKERMLIQAKKKVEEDLKHVKGVRGPSVLSIIPSADVSQCIVPEYLHSVLIGVVKQLLTIWTEKPGKWSIKNRISEIDLYLKTFKHPDFVHRNWRQLQSLKNWKASDFYYFLLFEGLPSLHGHLPDIYFQHFMLLVKGIFTLLKSSITEKEICEADNLLKLFVNEFLTLYGDRALTHNVHQLIHFGLCVRRYGPLFCFSAFPFEDLNGMVAKSTHGTNFVDAEIVNNIKICQGIQILQNIVRGTHGQNLPSSNFSQGEFLGPKLTSYALSPEELEVLDDPHPVIYARAMLGYDTYTSQVHKPQNSENFYVMWEQNGTKKYGSIRYFAQSRSGQFVVIQLFKVDHTSVFFHTRTVKCIEHFIPVNAINRYVAVKLEDIATDVIKVGKIDDYIYVRPHLYKFVL